MGLQFPDKPDKLTPTEQRILEYIEVNREEFLFMSIGQLSKRMGVCEASISRFARHMGCQDFKQLKHMVMEQNHLDGPAGKLIGTLLSGDAFHILQYLQKQQQFLEKTIAHLDTAIFERAITEICNARHILIHAKSASASMGQLLFFRLRRLGLPVSLLFSGGSEMLEGLSQVKGGDLVIFFGFSKISWEGRVILKQAQESGYHTLCFTSRLHIPEEDQANVNLYAYRGTEKEYHSMTAAAALVDALIVGVSERLGADGAKHLHQLHQLKKAYWTP